ncbi:MAG: hypothetical protein LBP79_06660, partial [Clostridiales bacterium]|nr:hypothetical protein [Clostridiales bacterium]
SIQNTGKPLPQPPKKIPPENRVDCGDTEPEFGLLNKSIEADGESNIIIIIIDKDFLKDVKLVNIGCENCGDFGIEGDKIDGVYF